MKRLATISEKARRYLRNEYIYCFAYERESVSLKSLIAMRDWGAYKY